MIRESGRFVLLADSDVCGSCVVWQERILIALSCFAAGYVVSWLHGKGANVTSRRVELKNSTRRVEDAIGLNVALHRSASSSSSRTRVNEERIRRHGNNNGEDGRIGSVVHVTRNLSPDPCFSRQRPGAKTNTSLLHLNRVSGEKALFRRVFDMSLPFPAFLLCFVLVCLVVMDCQSSARCRPAGVATGIAGQMGQHEDPEAMNEKLRLNLLHSLVSDVWVRLAPSRLHGVGVVAIRDIPKGTNPFRVANSGPCGGESDEGVIITEEQLAAEKHLSSAVMSYLQAYFHRFTCHAYIQGCPKVRTPPKFPDSVRQCDSNPRPSGAYAPPAAYGFPKGGLNSIDVSFFLNHAAARHANVVPVRVTGCRWYQFTTIRAIREGEELTFDYSVWGKSGSYSSTQFSSDRPTDSLEGRGEEGANGRREEGGGANGERDEYFPIYPSSYQEDGGWWWR